MTEAFKFGAGVYVRHKGEKRECTFCDGFGWQEVGQLQLKALARCKDCEGRGYFHEAGRLGRIRCAHSANNMNADDTVWIVDWTDKSSTLYTQDQLVVIAPNDGSPAFELNWTSE